MQCVKGGIGNLAISEDEYNHEYNLFDTIKRNVAIRATFTKQIKPNNQSIADDGPYEFEFPVIPDQYVDLAKSRLYVEGKVVNEDGSNLAATENVSVVNMFTPALFNELHVTSNNKTIHELTDENLNYKTFLENTLSYGQDAIKSHLTASHYENDTPGKYDNTDAQNGGYVNRKKIIANSKVFSGYFPLNSDFLSNDKLFPATSQLGIRLGRSNDKFVLISPEDKTYKINITKLILFVKYVELHPKIHEGILKQIQNKPIIIPFVRTEIKHSTMLTGTSDLQLNKLFSHKLPKTVILGFVDSDAYSNNKLSLNPFNFQHLNVNYACMKFNGKSVPEHAYEPDMTNNLFAREFREFFDNTGISHDNVGNSLNMSRFKGGQFLLAFNNNPDGCYHFHNHPAENGIADLSVKFSVPTTKSFTAIIFSTYDCAITFDSKKEIKVEYL